mmetsp:Transcript_5566/g.15761  ORF Transcript_5566/g.15761 Transcript_5566/m.15761 type:complete len:207 (-) Transcript_5566:404-1024(-)
MTPQAPQKPCTGEASKGSSILSLSSSSQAPTYTKEATKPHRMAAQGSTTEHEAVMPTRPASAPLHTAMRSHTPTCMYLIISVVMPAAAADSVVVTAVRPTATSAPSNSSMEPGLKPYQPNHRMKVPSTTRGAECPGMSTALPSESKRPMRGPTSQAPMRPATPPVMCTTPLPAKSIMPTSSSGELLRVLKAPSQPSVDHTQCTTTG